MASRLALYPLGSPRIEQVGVSISVETRMAIVLLANIALTGERHSPNSLVNLLWPACGRVRGRSAVRRNLYALRKALLARRLYADQGEDDPQPAPWLDADRER